MTPLMSPGHISSLLSVRNLELGRWKMFVRLTSQRFYFKSSASTRHICFFIINLFIYLLNIYYYIVLSIKYNCDLSFNYNCCVVYQQLYQRHPPLLSSNSDMTWPLTDIIALHLFVWLRNINNTITGKILIYFMDKPALANLQSLTPSFHCLRFNVQCSLQLS